MSAEAAGAIAAFREKLAAKNPRSESTAATPLSTFLEIYNKADYECYLNYMEGTKFLVNWLAPIDFHWELYPLVTSPKFQLHGYLGSYKLNELAHILQPLAPGYSHGQIANLIVLTSLSLSTNITRNSHE